MKQNYLLYNHTEEKGRELTILKSQKKDRGNSYSFSSSFPNSCFIFTSKKIKMTLKPLSHKIITTTSPKLKKHQLQHAQLNIHLQLDNRAWMLTTKKL